MNEILLWIPKTGNDHFVIMTKVITDQCIILKLDFVRNEFHGTRNNGYLLAIRHTQNPIWTDSNEWWMAAMQLSLIFEWKNYILNLPYLFKCVNLFFFLKKKSYFLFIVAANKPILCIWMLALFDNNNKWMQFMICSTMN